MPNRLSLLGGFDLRANGQHIELATSARRVVAFLALQEHAISRVYLAGTLWPDVSERRSLGNLRTALWTMHSAEADVIVSAGGNIRLAPTIAVDVHGLVRAAQAAIDRPEEFGFVRRFRTAAELLPDWYEDWVDRERERVRQLQLLALDAIAVNALEGRRYAQATEASLLAVQFDALRESSYRLLLRAHLAQGNLSDAQRYYRLFVVRLQGEIGIGPSSEMDALGRLAHAR